MIPHLFWGPFVAECDDLHRLAFAGQAPFVYHRIKELLARAKFHHVTELTSEGKRLSLVFSPECDSGIASEIDQFVLLAPPLEKWVVYTRRQPKPIMDALAMASRAFHVDVADARFTLQLQGQLLETKLYTAAYHRLEPNERKGFVLFILSHAVGEKFVMEELMGAELHPYPPPPSSLSPADFIEYIEIVSVD